MRVAQSITLLALLAVQPILGCSGDAFFEGTIIPSDLVGDRALLAIERWQGEWPEVAHITLVSDEELYQWGTWPTRDPLPQDRVWLFEPISIHELQSEDPSSGSATSQWQGGIVGAAVTFFPGEPEQLPGPPAAPNFWRDEVAHVLECVVALPEIVGGWTLVELTTQGGVSIIAAGTTQNAGYAFFDWQKKSVCVRARFVRSDGEFSDWSDSTCEM